jgi:adenosylcobyric acid synthase
MNAQAVAILGTGSDVGKSLIAAGLCRLFRRAGVCVAPFKAQNMSNNSFVTLDGKEIGRAQALQAQACGLDPQADMNPILLKPESDRRAQVVVQGKVWSTSDAQDYFQQHNELAQRVQESYERLAAQHAVIVIEGAGSAAEMNLRDRDLANWFSVELGDAKVLLVADIDRGGVFAQVIGTLDLLAPHERRRVIGIVINKFRGDAALFADGVSIIEQRTGVPVLGVLPFLRGLALDEEDSLDIERRRHLPFAADRVNIGVVLLPRMSNFTDFDQLTAEEDVILRYVAEPHELAGADVILIPGTKNTIEDLGYLRQAGFTATLREHVAQKREVVGICGGYQMLGRCIADPEKVEAGGIVEGMGFLDVTTRLLKKKITLQIEAVPLHLRDESAPSVRGYFIHMGETQRGNESPCFRIRSVIGASDQHQGTLGEMMDGAVTSDGMVWGTYIHGIFDRPAFRRVWLNRVRQRRGLPPVSVEQSEVITQRLNTELDRWTNHIEQHVNMNRIFSAMNLVRTTIPSIV